MSKLDKVPTPEVKRDLNIVVSPLHFRAAHLAARALNSHHDNPILLEKAAEGVAEAMLPMAQAGRKLVETLRAFGGDFENEEVMIALEEWARVNAIPTIERAAEVVTQIEADAGKIHIEGHLIHLGFGGDCAFDLTTVTTERELLAWVRHLSAKNWMNRRRIALFIEAVAKHKGWNISL